MYQVDIQHKTLTPLTKESFSQLGLRERFDLQEWVDSRPEILGEQLLIIAKELPLPSGIRLDLLAVDKLANLVVIELKREDSGRDVEWQAIKYASYCSSFLAQTIFEYFATYLGEDVHDAQQLIEDFIEVEIAELNQKQRLILVAQSFHSDVASAVLWLREFELDIKCIRLQAFTDERGQLFINPETIIPLPEARDYITRKEAKQKQVRQGSISSPFSMEIGEYDEQTLTAEWHKSLTRESDLTPRFRVFVAILLSEPRPFKREEIKEALYARGVGKNISQTGRYLSNISQLITKKGRDHLRQVITFSSDGGSGAVKDDYQILPEYRVLIANLLAETTDTEQDDIYESGVEAN